MERVVARENMLAALKRVERNGGAPGIDGIPTEQLRDQIRAEWNRIREELLQGTYRPKPVRQVEIPKPSGGKRMLGIPTVMDRLIQQALLQVLTPIFDPTFSESSYGFRPGRKGHDAVRRARQYVADGYEWVVDVDLEKFFDRVNHDVLMARVARRITDKRVLRLIRRFLQAGIMSNGVVMEREEGTPQGGPLSPLLANILLDDLDKELASARSGRGSGYSGVSADTWRNGYGSGSTSRRVRSTAHGGDSSSGSASTRTGEFTSAWRTKPTSV